MYFKLSKTARLLSIKNSKSIISTGTEQFFTNKEETEQIFCILEYLKIPRSKQEIHEFLYKKAIDKKLWKKLIKSSYDYSKSKTF